MRLLACLGMVLSFLEEVSCPCPSQCTCGFHSSTDGVGSRSVLCNDLDMTEVPTNVPVDTVKLRIEKTVVRSIPAEAFYYLVELQYLWVAYNSITSLEASSFYNLRQLHELRLDGNTLDAFPWASLLDMPRLRTLDLHNNRITSVPNEAVRYLKNLAYLDLSSNRLTTLPPEFLESWPHVLTTLPRSLDLSPRRIILVIQESPGEGVRWSIISLTGISYKDAGDYKCKAKNLAGISEAVVTVTVVGVVTTTVAPDTAERRPGGHPEQDVQTGSRRSMSIPGSPPSPWLSSSSSFSLSSSTFLSTSTSSPSSAASFSLSPFFSSTISSTTTLSTRISTSTTVASRQSLQLHPDGKRNLKVEMNGSKLPPASASKKEELALLDQAMPMETNATVENLRAVSGTKESVTLMWNTVNITHNPELSVLYSKHGEEDLLLLNADSSHNQITIEGLEPGGQYIACVSPKGVPPQKDQCITFSTDRVEEGLSPGPVLIAVSGTACVVVLPLIFFLLYKVCKLQCKSESFWEEDLAKETYIQFETLSPRSQSIGELWTRRHRDDSEKLLLCSGSSVESRMIFKSEGSRPEYYS
ncbi:leucine-rich repeat, immunoglobulin-like domain and transmembrane domain-containing protein 3 isoform 2-T2 [Glossophaga mutica]